MTRTDDILVYAGVLNAEKVIIYITFLLSFHFGRDTPGESSSGSSKERLNKLKTKRGRGRRFLVNGGWVVGQIDDDGVMTAKPRGDSSGFIFFQGISRKKTVTIRSGGEESGCQKCTGSTGRKFGLYHQTVKRAAIRILMAHFPGLFQCMARTIYGHHPHNGRRPPLLQ